jgi:hypothetical protein
VKVAPLLDNRDLDIDRMMSRFILAAAVLTFGVATAQAQTNDNAKVLLENEQVRVIEMRFPAGTRLDTLSQPNRFIYGLSDGALLFSPPGRTPYELSFKAGEALWLPAATMATRNEGDKEVRALVVELKDIRGKGKRSVPGKAKTSRVSAIKVANQAKAGKKAR